MSSLSFALTIEIADPKIGIVGLTFGGVRGVTRNYHPVAWALASGSRWTILGTAFWSRSLNDPFG